MKKHTKLLATLLAIAIMLSLIPYTIMAGAASAVRVLKTPELVYDSVYSYYEGLAWFDQNEKYGYIDTTGKVAIAPKFDRAGSFSDGLASVGTGSGTDMKYGYIDKSGNVVIPYQFDRAWDFYNGSAVVTVGGKSGIINKAGAYIAEPVYDGINIWLLRFGIIVVEQNGKCGVLAPDGKLIVPIEYDNAYNSMYTPDSLIIVEKDRKLGLVDRSGALIVPVQYDYIGYLSDGMIVVSVGTWGNMKYGYYDDSGKLVVPLEYDYAESFSDGRAMVGKGTSSDTRYGYIDKSGELIMPLEYDEISWFNRDFQKVNKDGRFGLIGMDGSEALAAEYDDISFYSEDKAWVKKDGFWGIIESVKTAAVSLWNILVSPTLVYDNVYPFSDGMARVGKGSYPDTKYGYVDAKGSLVLPMEYCDADMFVNGQAVVGTGTLGSAKYGVIDKSGKTVIDFKYDFIGWFSNDLLMVRLDGKRGIVDKSGKVTVPIIYDYIYPFNDDLLMVIQTGSNWSYSYGLVDKAGNVMLPVEYKAIYNDGSGYCRVQKGDKWGILDLSATVAPPPLKVTAKPTASAVLVDGGQKSFDAYNIEGNNYFKLRDLAYVLNGSAKSFEVVWDGANDAIRITSKQPYTVVGGEMTAKGDGNKTATQTSSRVFLDGAEVSLTAFNIDGNNYFKLRDVGAALDFSVVWDGANNSIIIDTSEGYTLE